MNSREEMEENRSSGEQMKENEGSSNTTEEGNEGESMDAEDDTNDMWQFLPSVPLRNIFSYVSRQDQTNLSLVCKRWSHEFGAPDNWKRMKFFFPERPHSEEVYPIVRIARRFGHMFRHLEVICRYVATSMSECSSEQFHLFVDAVSQSSKLRSLSFDNLKPYLRWLDEELRENVVSSITHLLRTQNYLQSLEFKKCDFRRAEGISILNAVFLRTAAPVRKLKFEKFLCHSDFEIEDENQEDEERSGIGRLQWVLNCLNRVEEWNCEYDQLFEDIIRQFPNILQGYKDSNSQEALENGALKTLIVTFDEWSNVDIQGIPSRAWKMLHKHCPRLEVDFSIDVAREPNTIETLLPGRLPLRSLSFRLLSRQVSSETYSTAQLFNHIINTQLSETLEELHLVWMSVSLQLAEELDNFVRRCPRLKTVEIQASHPLLQLQNLFESWIGDCPKGIQTVFISVTNIPNEEVYSELNSMADNFVPILQVLGVNFSLILESTDFL